MVKAFFTVIVLGIRAQLTCKHKAPGLPPYLPEELLQDPGGVVEPLPLTRRGDDLQLLAGRELLLELLVHLGSKLKI